MIDSPLTEDDRLLQKRMERCPFTVEKKGERILKVILPDDVCKDEDWGIRPQSSSLQMTTLGSSP